MRAKQLDNKITVCAGRGIRDKVNPETNRVACTRHGSVGRRGVLLAVDGWRRIPG